MARPISYSKPTSWVGLLGSGKTYGAPPSEVAPHCNRPGVFSPLLPILTGPDDVVVVVVTFPQAASNDSRVPLTAMKPPAWPARFKNVRLSISRFMYAPLPFR